MNKILFSTIAVLLLLNLKTTNSQTCLPGCATCSNANPCLTCASTHYMATSLNICLPKPPGCSTATSSASGAPTCTACTAPLILVSATCVPCSPPCATC